MRYFLNVFFVAFLWSICSFAQPVNDNCTNAILIDVPNNGFGTGVLQSTNIDIGNASIQQGEVFAPAILIADQTQKSIWYKFTIASARSVKITVNQSNAMIVAGDVGFATYKANTCLPSIAQLSSQLTPIAVFGSSFHPCLDSGTYYIQVSSKQNTRGLVGVELEIDMPNALYDNMQNAYQFGVLNQARKNVTLNIACHSKETELETCNMLPSDYTKSAWFTFTTPAQFDYLVLALSGDGYYNNWMKHTFGFRVFRGDVRSTSLNLLGVIRNCDTLQTNGFHASARTFACSPDFVANQTYSVQLFFHKDFEESVKLGLLIDSFKYTSKTPNPRTNSIHPESNWGIIDSSKDVSTTDFFTCMNTHEYAACGTAKTAPGVVYQYKTYNLSGYTVFSTTDYNNLTLSSTLPTCNTVLIRLFKDTVDLNCTTLSANNLVAEGHNSVHINCLEPGDYVVQVLSSWHNAEGLLNSDLTNSNNRSCLLGDLGSPFRISAQFRPAISQSQFSLQQSSQVNRINNGSPLQRQIYYSGIIDTFGCSPTALPANTGCPNNNINRNDRAIYRTFTVADSGAITITNQSEVWYTNYELFKGDAQALVIAQNAWSPISRFTGLTPIASCFTTNPTSICLEPGTYSILAYGDSNLVSKTTNTHLRYNVASTRFSNPNSPENLGSILDTLNNANGIIATSFDVFSCNNNAVTIDRMPPCGGATKAIYRQFYVSQPLEVTIHSLGTTNYSTILFKGQVSSVGTSGLILEKNCFTSFSTDKCRYLMPGWYTIVTYATGNSYGVNNILSNHLGGISFLTIEVNIPNDINQFSLNVPNAYDSINDNRPLVYGNDYVSRLDSFDCFNSILPDSQYCSTYTRTKAIYRQFTTVDSGAISATNLVSYFAKNNYWQTPQYGLFKGDANALALSQNVWSYPSTITGLTKVLTCYSGFTSLSPVCITPGTYSFVEYGNGAFVGEIVNQPIFSYNKFVSRYSNPNSPDNMGDVTTLVGANGGVFESRPDTFSCLNNAITIGGVAPCDNRTKAIYREFYVSKKILLGLESTNFMSLFSGRLSVLGVNGVTPIWSCFLDKSNHLASCNVIEEGWYTLVSYGSGSSYDEPDFSSLSDLGKKSTVIFRISYDCRGADYNRPYKAAVDSVTQNPFVLSWNFAADTGAYPITSKTYHLPTAYFNCTVDTPFASHPIVSCNNAYRKIAYYTFELDRKSYVNISYEGYFFANVYNKDVRVDSALFATLVPIQGCSNNKNRIELCNLSPGVYTLVILGYLGCTEITPKLTIDKVGKSRFDFASNAYDFGVIAPINAYQNGKTMDVNPLDPNRAPSSDFFYCTTGASVNDPSTSVCYTIYNSNIYDTTVLSQTTGSYISRRNLWYTFVIDRPGIVAVKVANATSNRVTQLPYSIYASDVDGSIDFAQIVANGMVDSTLLQGLTLVGHNIGGSCNSGNLLASEISFRSTNCMNSPKRYYVIINNKNTISGAYNMTLNYQVDVSVKLDASSGIGPRFDYYSQAGDFGTIGIGNHRGPEDNFSCATLSGSYPSTLPSCASKTLWYRFTLPNGFSGKGNFGQRLDGLIGHVNHTDMVVYREEIVGDSTSLGLTLVPFQFELSDYYTVGTCLTGGTYYIVYTGCNRTTSNIIPTIDIAENLGDYCSSPVDHNITGVGNFTSSSVITCHTIGTDYGEFGSMISCPPGAQTNQYKTSWFKINIAGQDTLDATIYLANNTSAPSAQIHYRMMTGDCNAMQEQSCVMDALTQNTYKCLFPNTSYYIQVFVPQSYSNNPTVGSIDLIVNAVKSIDTCVPPANCLVNARFTSTFDCSVSDSVEFINSSTFGNNVQYLWDFGFNNQTSTAFSPWFVYPALPIATTYQVRLRAVNIACYDTSYAVQYITIPARPFVSLGNDTISCRNGDSVLLSASNALASSYLWNTNDTTSSIYAKTTGRYYVTVSYNGCVARDSINVYISNQAILPLQYKEKCNALDSISLLGRNNSNYSYIWNTGQRTSTIKVQSAGYYWVDFDDGYCSIRDSFLVNNRNDSIPLLGNDTSICFHVETLLLNANRQAASNYLWNTNATTPSIQVDTPGMYWVKINEGSCVFYDTIVVSASSFVNILAFDTICFGASYLLPKGSIVNAPGIYYDTLFSSSAFCDSIIITTLVMRDFDSTVVNQRICNTQLPFVWNGILVPAGGNAVASYATINQWGCDSFVTLNLNVNQLSIDSVFVTSCSNQLPYIFNGRAIATAGVYADTLINFVGCDSLIVLSFSINAIDIDTLSVEVCQGNSYTFHNATYDTSGFYSARYTNVLGCDSIKVLELTVHPIPNAPVVINPIIYCQNAVTTNLTATGSNLLWYDTLAGGIGFTNPPIPSSLNLGNSYYYVSQTINNCESPRSRIEVNVYEKPQLSINVLPDSLVCSNEIIYVNYTGSNHSNVTLMWDWDGAIVNGVHPDFTAQWTTEGQHRVALWIDNNGCKSDTLLQGIIVKQAPSSSTIQMIDTVCLNENVTIASEIGNASTYYWTINGAPITEGRTFLRQMNSAGWKIVTLMHQNDNGCLSSLTIDSIYVAEMPNTKIDFNADWVCADDTLILNLVNPTANTDYVWGPSYYFGDGLNNSGYQSTAFITTSGNVYVTAINPAGCISSDTVFVNTKACCDVFISNAFSPNGDGLNDYFDIISEANQTIVEFSIYNRSGQRVFSSKNSNNKWDGTFNGESCDVGVYFYYIEYRCYDGQEFKKKGDITLIR